MAEFTVVAGKTLPVHFREAIASNEVHRLVGTVVHIHTSPATVLGVYRDPVEGVRLFVRFGVSTTCWLRLVDLDPS